ncbi:MAG TPA: hypothetical protein VEA44_18140 [Caulobacter sp.]|nr:hypothetical protein [Caulobacter sp.]
MLARLVAAGAMALCLAVGSTGAQNPPKTRDEARVFLRNMLDTQSGGTYPILRQAYPSEYAAFEDELVTVFLDDAKTGNDMQVMIAQFEARIAGRLTSQVKMAPDEDLVLLIKSQYRALKALEQAHNVACYELGEKGAVSAASNPEVGLGPRPALHEFSRISLKTGLAGRDRPTQHKRLTPAAYAKIAKTFEKRGGSREYLDLLNAGQTDQAAPGFRCKQIVLFYEVLSEQPAEVIGSFFNQ